MHALNLPLRLWRRVGRREPEPGVAREAGVRPLALTPDTDGEGRLIRRRCGRRAGELHLQNRPSAGALVVAELPVPD